MPCTARKFVRVTKFLLAGVTVFCVSWIASVNEWHAGVRWDGRRANGKLTTMRTIVAYSEGKQAEMDRPSPVTCDRLPAYPEIPYINRSWTRTPSSSSWQRVDGTSVSVYAAYYDERTPQRYVRILAIFHGRNFSVVKPLFCQTRLMNSGEDAVEVVAAKPLEIWWHEWDVTSSNIDTPLLLSCPLTEPLYGPSIVSVVTEPCDHPTNAFHLQPTHNIYKYKRTFTICVKDMQFDKDVSQNLIEWIETNKILGVEIIDMYIDNISNETEEVLLHYQSLGYVRLFRVPINYKPDRSLWQRRRDHIITYNDCLYRNIMESEFVIPLDVDEVLLPKMAYTLTGLLKRLKNHGWNSTQYSAILVQNVFFFDFMQGIDKYKPKKANSSDSKIYIKRDDVRLEFTIQGINEIELVDYTNSFKYGLTEGQHVEEELNQKYTCGKTVPKLARHIIRSAVVSPVGYYSKSLMVTKRVLTAFNHYPLASLGASGFDGWSAPFTEVQLNHYKESCNTTMVEECTRYGRRARLDRTALRLRPRLSRALAALCTRINNTR